MAGDDEHVQVLPPRSKKKKPALHTSPSTSPFYSGKKRNMVVSHFFSVELFYLVISLSCCGLCSEESLHVALVRLSSVPRQVFLHSFFSSQPHDLVSAGFLVMKSPMFTIVIQENNFFLKNHLFLLICTLL